MYHIILYVCGHKQYIDFDNVYDQLITSNRLKFYGIEHQLAQTMDTGVYLGR